MQFPARRRGTPPIPTMGIAQMLESFPDAPVAADLRAAVLAAQKDYAAVHEAHGRIAADRTLTDGGRLVRQAKFAKTKMAAAVDRLAAAKAKAAEFQAHLGRQIAAPFDFKDRRFCDVELAAEIRSYFRALPTSERMSAMTKAIR